MSSDDEWFIEHDLIILREMGNIFCQVQKSSVGKSYPRLSWCVRRG